ncbi:hypothetical protein FB471_2285 [Amycolatopsis cihanbeyliensis]|uniref:Uncharacterized protein n=2 Tax=Amycolatopsis cihanbeyliensis TaxID=1128664 RepID=A0A542DHJ1_AMYCI|nr:hypothetical protein FB471_2285 [Amycolatopsis cihanbeyliensis]
MVLRDDGAVADIPELAWMAVATPLGIALIAGGVLAVRLLLLRRRSGG